MFIIRKDVYRKRELADRLKMAFATAASAGLGLGASWLFGGRTGALAYSLASVYEYVKASKIEAAWRRETYSSTSQVPFHQIKPEIDRISKIANIPPPPVFYTQDLTSGSDAMSDSKNILMGIHFANRTDHSGTYAVLAHEICHIKNKDSDRVKLLHAYSRATIDTSILTVLGGGMTVLYRGVSGADLVWSLAYLAGTFHALKYSARLQSFLKGYTHRVMEFRADRFAAGVTQGPLDAALERFDHPTLYPSSDTCSFTERLESTHPPDSHRIKALVQLCKRVPDPDPT